MGVPNRPTDDDLWKNVAANFARLNAKETATGLLERAARLANEAIKGFQAGCRGREWNRYKGKPEVVVPANTQYTPEYK